MIQTISMPSATYHIEFDFFSITNWTYRLLWIVFDNCRLMDKYVFFGVVTIDEAVAAFNVEPFHSSRYFFSYWKKKWIVRSILEQSHLICMLLIDLITKYFFHGNNRPIATPNILQSIGIVKSQYLNISKYFMSLTIRFWGALRSSPAFAIGKLSPF